MSQTEISRRSLLGAAAVVAAARAALAGAPSDVIALWPAAPPDGSGPSEPEHVSAKGAVTDISKPRLVAYRPSQPNGAAVVVIAGGGYVRIEAGPESTPACQWLRSIGVTAFELIYRLPGEGWSRNAPLQDGQRAVRIVRANAASYGIDPARIGVIGFSAGGHLAGMTATQPDRAFYAPADAADSLSARPNFCGLIYPVLSMMPPFDHTHARREIVGAHPSAGESEAFSVERHVDEKTPPTFLAQAADDPISPIDNSLMMFNALRGKNVAAEMHVFQSGGHGWGMGEDASEVSAWPRLFARWAAQNSFLPAEPPKGG
jgi:acetyl esterase/lipase